MEYTLEAGFGSMFAVHEDVDTPLEVGRQVTVGFSQKGPVLLPEA
jgi:iron(III) transport system ATP-binding protein